MDLSKMRVKRLSVSLNFMQFHVVPSLPGLLIGENFDLLHAHEYRDFLGTVGFAVAKAKGKPFILQTHGSLYGYTHTLPRHLWKPYTAYDRATKKAIVRKADRIVVSAGGELEEAIAFGAEPDRIRVIPPGIPVAPEGKRTRDPPHTFLFVGRIAPRRRVHDIIRAFAQTCNENPTHLYLVGGEEKLSSSEQPQYYDCLVDLAGKLGVADRVSFTGPLYGQALEDMYRMADVFLYASAYENFGQPLLEAAAHGLPIVSTPVGVARDIVIPDKTGVLFDVGDVRAMAEHIKGMAGGRYRLDEMSKQLIEIVRLKYDWKNIIVSYREMYEELLTR